MKKAIKIFIDIFIIILIIVILTSVYMFYKKNNFKLINSITKRFVMDLYGLGSYNSYNF